MSNQKTLIQRIERIAKNATEKDIEWIRNTPLDEQRRYFEQQRGEQINVRGSEEAEIDYGPHKEKIKVIKGHYVQKTH